MKRFAITLVVALGCVEAASAQSMPTAFELSVTTESDRTVSVECLRGCTLLVLVSPPTEPMQWDSISVFRFNCAQRKCSSGRVLSGTVTQVNSPAFDLWITSGPSGTTVRCTRACDFSAPLNAPNFDQSGATRVQEVMFTCSGESCASGTIGGRVIP